MPHYMQLAAEYSCMNCIYNEIAYSFVANQIAELFYISAQILLYVFSIVHQSDALSADTNAE